MEVPDFGPPKTLTIMHKEPDMGPHVVSDRVRLQVHDCNVPCEVGLILRWLSFRGVDILIWPGYSMYSHSISILASQLGA